MPYIHKHVVCVCVCASEQKGKPSCSTGGGLGDRMAIHSQRHGVCVYGKRENHPVPPGGGGAGSPSSLARTHGWKTTKLQGWGEGMPQEAEHKTTAVGYTTMGTPIYIYIYQHTRAILDFSGLSRRQSMSPVFEGILVMSKIRAGRSCRRS